MSELFYNAVPNATRVAPPLPTPRNYPAQIRDNFYSVQREMNWTAGMPTNALLVSGPSKTADIEQVLAYGAHGPKDLIVLILEDA